MSQSKLNAEQLQIVNHVFGAILVLAPVGSGKTSVLSERVVSAINAGIPAKKILCLTFTNRAAKEMKERLAKRIPEHFRDLTIKTFHGLCASIIRIESRQIGLASDFVIYDNEDCLEIIKSLVGVGREKEAGEILGRIANCKIKASKAQLSLNYLPQDLFLNLELKEATIAKQYQSILKENHALDFADLIFYVRAIFHELPDVKSRWAESFDFMQVDEVQDTHLSEYEIVYSLSHRHGNLAMIGDLDQTIYEWRGSEPDEVLNKFKRDFQADKYSLTLNYRATKTLLNAASNFANSFAIRQTQITPAPECESGEPIIIHSAFNQIAEVKWIADNIKLLAKGNSNFAYNKVAILARTNKRIELISNELEKYKIPCITFEQYQFFTRQEIKDALAYIRFILNRFDTVALRRMLMRPTRGIGQATINNIVKEGQECGLKLVDILLPETFIDSDPFGEIIKLYESQEIVVFDVETTGLVVSRDEIVEIAAEKIIGGTTVGKFHAYIVNTIDVGYSQNIHKHSNEFLAQNGLSASQVFREFFEFARGSLLVGHNVGFDIKMITAHANKVGVNVPKLKWADTLDIATRFINSNSYKLEELAVKFQLSKPNHRATNDVRTTVELLEILIPLIKYGEAYRQALINKYYEGFELLTDLAKQVEAWRDASQQLRPAALLKKVLLESGLLAYYESDSKRINNLLELVKIFQEQDKIDLHAETSLRSIIEFTALAKNIDQISSDNNQVPVVTIHQAKGLEFDTVFIAGVSENEIPSFLSKKFGSLEEEKRLFYVAMTRAKKRLFISGYNQNQISQFINLLPK
ncbi:UvrD/REP helicase (plasmid) [Nostoc sp. NIES-2111]|nr:UvrD/REP helicase [Nostoc sp. NIES-2111]